MLTDLNTRYKLLVMCGLNFTQKTFKQLHFSGSTKPRRKILKTNGKPVFVTTTPAYFQRVVKHNSRSPVQLKFDLAVMKYLASTSLSFNHVDTEGFRQFVKYLDPKMHVKSSRTFSRAKLPLLYKIVKAGVANKLETDLKDPVGVALTTDMWSSK
jgi:hypothetical protein